MYSGVAVVVGVGENSHTLVQLQYRLTESFGHLSRLKHVSFVKFCKELAEKSMIPRLLLHPRVLLRPSTCIIEKFATKKNHEQISCYETFRPVIIFVNLHQVISNCFRDSY